GPRSAVGSGIVASWGPRTKRNGGTTSGGRGWRAPEGSRKPRPSVPCRGFASAQPRPPDSERARTRKGAGGTASASLRLLERLGIDLVEDLELGDRLLEELLAAALDLGLRGLLDAAEVLVVGESRLHGGLLAHEARHLGRLPDGQAALLVEVEREILPVRRRHLDAQRGLVADLRLAGGLEFERLVL